MTAVVRLCIIQLMGPIVCFSASTTWFSSAASCRSGYLAISDCFARITAWSEAAIRASSSRPSRGERLKSAEIRILLWHCWGREHCAFPAMVRAAPTPRSTRRHRAPRQSHHRIPTRATRSPSHCLSKFLAMPARSPTPRPSSSFTCLSIQVKKSRPICLSAAALKVVAQPRRLSVR